jgi:hypothetical protein
MAVAAAYRQNASASIAKASLRRDCEWTDDLIACCFIAELLKDLFDKLQFVAAPIANPLVIRKYRHLSPRQTEVCRTLAVDSGFSLSRILANVDTGKLKFAVHRFYLTSKSPDW